MQFLKDRLRTEFDLNIGSTRLQVVAALKSSDNIDHTLEQTKELESF